MVEFNQEKKKKKIEKDFFFIITVTKMERMAYPDKKEICKKGLMFSSFCYCC